MIGVLFPIGTILNFAKLRRAFSNGAPESPWLTVIEISYAALFGILIVTAIVVALAIVNLKPWAPRLTRMFLVSVPLSTPSLLLVPFVLSWSGLKAQHWQVSVVQSLVSNVLSSLICLSYFSVSRRVRVNFPSDRRQPDSSQ
jgi:hypothetical protein